MSLETKADIQRKNALLYLFQKVWFYAGSRRKYVVMYWSAFVVAMIISLLGQPYLFAQIVNYLTVNAITDQNYWYLMRLLLCTGLVDIAFWCLHGPGRVLEQLTGFDIRTMYRSYLAQGILTLPLAWHTEHHSGDTIDRIEKGTKGLHMFAENSFLVVYGCVQFLVSFCVLAYFSGYAGAIVILMISFAVGITVLFDRYLVVRYDENNEKENAIAESVNDTISNIVTVIFLRAEKRLHEWLCDKIAEPRAHVRWTIIVCEVKWFLISMCCTTMVIVVFALYFWQHKNGSKIVLGNFFMLYQYLKNLSDLFFKITGMYGDILQERSRVANVEVLTRDFTDESLANHVLPSTWKRIEVKSLSFSYEGMGSEPNLSDVSFSICRGERIAVIGGSGSGKSTLFKLLRGLYSPQRMILSVDGVVIPDGFDGISRAFALIPQDPEVFATTMEANVTFGAKHPIERVRYFTDIACATEFIDRLPKGFASSMKEKGVTLSGGQKQRLSLARGLLACDGKDVLLLDESLSAVDMVTERAVYTNIFDAFREKAIVVSTHRLHLLPLFDRIFVFDKGRLVSTGTFAELMARCPVFTTQWEASQVETVSSAGLQ